MYKFFKFMRDPIWQAVGVLVSVLIVFFTISTPTSTNGELAIVKTQSIKFSDYLLPNSILRLNLPKSNQSMDGAIVDYFIMINKGAKPILPNEYSAPLTLKSKSSEEIFLVDSCAQPNDSSLGKDDAKSCKPGSFVSSTWQQHDGAWIQDRALLNSGEQFCVIVIRKSPKDLSNAPLGWEARIVGVKTATYDSLGEYSKSLEKGLGYYLQTTIRLAGFAAYWFVALQLAAFYATLVLARQARWLRTSLHSPIWPVALAMLLSTSTAEILVDIFINLNFTHLSPLVWPLLLAHLLLIAYLVKRAIHFRLATAPTTSSEAKEE